MEDNVIEVYDEHNNKVEIIILNYFTLKKNNKDYIIYKFKKMKHGLHIYSAEVVEFNDMIKLKEITDKEIIDEIKEVEKVYNG